MARRRNPQRSQVEIYSRCGLSLVLHRASIGLEHALETAVLFGKRRLERADLGGRRVIWRPFQLNPTMPNDGMDRHTYLKAKFGGAEALRGMEDRLTNAGEDDGIRVCFRSDCSGRRILSQPIGSFGMQDSRANRTKSSRSFSLVFLEGSEIGESDDPC